MRRVRVPHAAVAIVALALASCHRAATSTALGYGTLVPVGLVDQDGKSFDAARLRGRVWITAFLFTTCPMECPLLAQRMQWLQGRLTDRAPALQLLAVSINPAQDTPAVLREYGARFGRDPLRWTFVTGHTAPWYRVIGDGYERARPAPDPNDPRSAGTFAALHGERFALVDGEGRIRGFYKKDDAEVARMLADAEQLLR